MPDDLTDIRPPAQRLLEAKNAWYSTCIVHHTRPDAGAASLFSYNSIAPDLQHVLWLVSLALASGSMRCLVLSTPVKCKQAECMTKFSVPPQNVEDPLRPRGGTEAREVNDLNVVVRVREHVLDRRRILQPHGAQ